MYEKTEGQASYENAEDQASRLRQQYGRLQVLEREGEELSLSDRLRAMNRPLLAWYEAHARVLPWREDPEPYRVWICMAFGNHAPTDPGRGGKAIF